MRMPRPCNGPPPSARRQPRRPPGPRARRYAPQPREKQRARAALPRDVWVDSTTRSTWISAQTHERDVAALGLGRWQRPYLPFVQISSEPVARQLGNLFQRAGLLEEVRGAGN